MENFEAQFKEREFFENRFHAILAKGKAFSGILNPISETETQNESSSNRG